MLLLYVQAKALRLLGSSGIDTGGATVVCAESCTAALPMGDSTGVADQKTREVAMPRYSKVGLC